MGAEKQEKKVSRHYLTSPNPVRDYLPRILSSYIVIYSVKISRSKWPKGSNEGRWMPIGMNDLNEIKQAVVSYGFGL